MPNASSTSQTPRRFFHASGNDGDVVQLGSYGILTAFGFVVVSNARLLLSPRNEDAGCCKKRHRQAGCQKREPNATLLLCRDSEVQRAFGEPLKHNERIVLRHGTDYQRRV